MFLNFKFAPRWQNLIVTHKMKSSVYVRGKFGNDNQFDTHGRETSRKRRGRAYVDFLLTKHIPADWLLFIVNRKITYLIWAFACATFRCPDIRVPIVYRIDQ